MGRERGGGGEGGVPSGGRGGEEELEAVEVREEVALFVRERPAEALVEAREARCRRPYASSSSSRAVLGVLWRVGVSAR